VTLAQAWPCPAVILGEQSSSRWQWLTWCLHAHTEGAGGVLSLYVAFSECYTMCTHCIWFLLFVTCTASNSSLS
jgi:hypothetical protein